MNIHSPLVHYTLHMGSTLRGNLSRKQKHKSIITFEDLIIAAASIAYLKVNVVSCSIVFELDGLMETLRKRDGCGQREHHIN